MLNRWNKLFAVAALAMALPVVANAQSSRVEGMALQGDFIKDYTAIFTYPSQVPHVGNLVYGEFGQSVGLLGGTPTDRGVGAVLGNLWEGRYGTWAIHLRETTPSLGQATTNSQPGVGVGGQDLNTNADHSFDVEWGKRFGGTSFGLRLNRSYNQTEVNTATTQTITDLADTSTFHRNSTGFGAGIGFEVNPSSTFEGSVLWESRKFQHTITPIGGATNRSEDSPTTFELAARLMWQWEPNVMVVPVFKYYSFDYGYKVTVGTATTTRKATQKGWEFGGAGNWTLNQNDLFVLGAVLTRSTFEQDTNVFPGTPVPGKLEESILPGLFAALETHVNPWLTVRFGANQGANQFTKATATAPGAGSTKNSFSDFNMNLGVGVKVGGLQFDAICDNDFFNRFTQLSGIGAPAFAKVTATYPF